MSTHKKHPIIVTTLERRKWFRRGRAIAEFTTAICIVVGEAIVAVVAKCGSLFFHAICSIMRHRKTATVPSRTPRTSSSASQDTTGRLVAPICIQSIPQTTFADVAGLEEAKHEILVRSLLPIQHPQLAAEYNITTGGNILLWGPPGCGKTLLARAVAGQLGASFFLIRPSDIITHEVGKSEKNIAALFKAVQTHKQAVLCIDEVEALFPARRRNRSTIMQRVITEFLTQIDGVDTHLKKKNSCYRLMVGMTNWPEAIDEAFLRPGRLDVRVFVDLPDYAARKQILTSLVCALRLAPDVSIDMLAADTEGYSGADLTALVDAAKQSAFVLMMNSTLHHSQDVQDTTVNPVTTVDFAAALDKVLPSVSVKELKRYRELASRQHTTVPNVPEIHAASA